ncbi:MAG TPA: choice-of-anchor P family protein [Lapillicoccus sp.]|nr:choice-of-anchor P family protein [Lapillicoccus sp.]
MKGRVAVVLLAVLCAGIALAAPASADVTDVSGSGAFGESVDVSVLGTGSVTSGPTPSVTLPAGGGGPVTDSLVNVNLPGVLTTGLLNVSTQGSNLGTHGGTSTSSAQVVGATVLGALAPSLGSPLLTADVISSQCTSNGDGSSGSSTLAGLTIAGSPVAVNPPPNTTIDVLGAVSVTLNEQIVSNSPGETSITVNAVHVRLNLDGIASGDVILSQSRCRAAGPDVLEGAPGGPGGPGGPEGPGGPGAATPATPVTATPTLTG